MPSIIKLAFFILILVLLSSITTTRKRKKKIRNIEKGNRIINRINEFEGEAKEAKAITYLRKIDAYVFEELLLSALEKKGFQISRNKRYSHDGGVDGRATYNGQLYYIQAKRYSKYVSLKHLEAFESIVGNNKGLFVHTGKTGKNTFNKYRNSNVIIISGSRLIALLFET